MNSAFLKMANENGETLVIFLRDGGMVAYEHSARACKVKIARWERNIPNLRFKRVKGAGARAVYDKLEELCKARGMYRPNFVEYPNSETFLFDAEHDEFSEVLREATLE